VLTPLQAGALKRDSGTISGNWRSILGRNVMRDGQEVTIFDGALWTLTGKRGTLTIRDRNEWVAVGNDDGVAVGNWKVVRGTGQYAGIVGKGRNGHAGLGHPVVRALRGLPHPSLVPCTRRAARARAPHRLSGLAGAHAPGVDKSVGCWASTRSKRLSEEARMEETSPGFAQPSASAPAGFVSPTSAPLNPRIS